MFKGNIYFFFALFYFLSARFIIYSNELDFLALSKNKSLGMTEKEAQIHKTKNSTPSVDSVGLWPPCIILLHAFTEAPPTARGEPIAHPTLVVSPPAKKLETSETLL